MAKKVVKRIIRENAIDGAPGGGSGTLNYGQQYGTPGGGNTTQGPSHFSSSDKTQDHFHPNTASGSAVSSTPDGANKNTIKTGYPDGKIVNFDGETDDGEGITGQKMGKKIMSPARCYGTSTI